MRAGCGGVTESGGGRGSTPHSAGPVERFLTHLVPLSAINGGPSRGYLFISRIGTVIEQHWPHPVTANVPEPRVFTSDRFSALRGQLSPGKLVDVQNVSIQAVPAPPERRAAHGPRPRVDGPARRACVRSVTTVRFTRTGQQQRNNPGLHHPAAGQQIWTFTSWCRRGQFHIEHRWLSRAARSEQTDSASFVGGGFSGPVPPAGSHRRQG